MNFFRIIFSLLMGFAASLFLALTFLGYSTVDSPIDRLFLLLVPALAIGLILYQASPSPHGRSASAPNSPIPNPPSPITCSPSSSPSNSPTDSSATCKTRCGLRTTWRCSRQSPSPSAV
ncbi:MAG TPA: hypothetical protein PLF42_17940 [Anaerolineales bacterium]|nr:hypothetical protein [Anaerolineales bacterium]